MRSKVLNGMPIGYALHKIILNNDGIPCDYEYLEANAAFEQATGLLAADIIGKKVTQVLPDIKNDEFDWINVYGELALKETRTDFEQYSHVLKKWYKVSAFSPEYGYFATLVTDITEEKEINKSLSENNTLISEFFDSGSDMIFLKDEKLRYVYANKALSDFFGKQPEEILGKDDYTLYPAVMAEGFRAKDMEVLKSGSKNTTEEVLSDKTFEIMRFPISYPNGASGVGAFIKDITYIKRQEDSLKRQIHRLNILVDVFMKNFQSRQELLDYTLHKALELTSSQYGYIYLYDEEKCEFTLNSWTIGVMADCEVVGKKTIYQLEKTGIWGEVVRQRRPIVVNDMAKPNSLKRATRQAMFNSSIFYPCLLWSMKQLSPSQVWAIKALITPISMSTK